MTSVPNLHGKILFISSKRKCILNSANKLSLCVFLIIYSIKLLPTLKPIGCLMSTWFGKVEKCLKLWYFLSTHVSGKGKLSLERWEGTSEVHNLQTRVLNPYPACWCKFQVADLTKPKIGLKKVQILLWSQVGRKCALLLKRFFNIGHFFVPPYSTYHVHFIWTSQLTSATTSLFKGGPL